MNLQAATKAPAPVGLKPVAQLAASRPHGDRLRYMAGCRCHECRAANTQYERQRAAARKAGDWNGLVSADRARAHMAALSAAGVGRRQVGDAAGISDTVLAKIVTGKRTNVRALTERAILAVTKAAAADGAYIDARPTWKLLRGLLAMGYSKTRLAHELGYEGHALQIQQKRCTARNAYDVDQLYKRLRRVPAKATLRRLQALRDEGYRPARIEAMVADLAAEKGLQPPDLAIYGRSTSTGFISAVAAELVAELHQRETEE